MELHELLRGDRVKKSYRALVRGHWPDQRTEVDAPLAKGSLRSGERMVEVQGDGKEALTRFRVIERFRFAGEGERPFSATLVEAMPVTGRTHQIRVHAAHADHPIAGDDKYGDAAFDRALRSRGLDRLFLHAARIQIPRTGQKDLRVEAPLPPELERVLAALRAG
jgi:23S rRNA pseudouridine955/2504/2580 synthase